MQSNPQIVTAISTREGIKEYLEFFINKDKKTFLFYYDSTNMYKFEISFGHSY